MIRQIPFARPWLGEEEADAVAEVVRSGWVMQGPKVALFEDLFRDRVGSAHACAVSNCTTALQLSLLAAGVGFGDVVITTSHSFIATANAIRACGAEPVFCDIDADTLNLCPQRLATLVETAFERRDDQLWYGDALRLARGESPLAAARLPVGRLAAVLVVHQAGVAADLARILPIADAAGVPVIEDAACALGSEISLDDGATWAPIGRPHGLAACFSFHPRKVITTGEGGMVSSNRAEIDRLVRLRREHGMTVSTLDRDSHATFVPESYVTTGFNYRMTDLQAAMGIVQMSRLAEIIARRRQLGLRMGTGLAAVAGVRAPFCPPYARVNHQSYILLLDDPGRQQRVMGRLKERGVVTRMGITCIHSEPPYREAWPAGCLPASERARADSIILPMHPGLDDDDIDHVVESIRVACND
ncbi:MAG: DegT/DnrJ/EryC1/StrS aminotransferase family protein [Magnetospirillum sp.]|nr:DegT/DnrJ/EryC1/StrS aminotransferase family protein [Magnetospirillum sp.]